ncbi:hypothetical protein Misp04_32130 [Micromonospora sp. NBRC 101691]|nr:hypothetical protein Misp04_32130 [Micromonospora sp. NBRC 101691]
MAPSDAPTGRPTSHRPPEDHELDGQLDLSGHVHFTVDAEREEGSKGVPDERQPAERGDGTEASDPGDGRWGLTRHVGVPARRDTPTCRGSPRADGSGEPPERAGERGRARLREGRVRAGPEGTEGTGEKEGTGQPWADAGTCQPGRPQAMPGVVATPRRRLTESAQAMTRTRSACGPFCP